MKSDEDWLHNKIVDHDAIYNFVVDKFLFETI
jgi:hypothetical protein